HIAFGPDSGQRELADLATVAGGVAGGAVEGPTDRSAGGRGVARRRARLGDRRGPRAAVPLAPGARPRRRRAAHRDLATTAASTRSGRGCTAARGGDSRRRPQWGRRGIRFLPTVRAGPGHR